VERISDGDFVAETTTTSASWGNQADLFGDLGPLEPLEPSAVDSGIPTAHTEDSSDTPSPSQEPFAESARVAEVGGEEAWGPVVLSSTTLSGVVAVPENLWVSAGTGSSDSAIIAQDSDTLPSEPDFLASQTELLLDALYSAQGPPEAGSRSLMGTGGLEPVVPPERPLLVIHGIGGSFPARETFESWLRIRGFDPTLMLLDPLKTTYDDLMQSLVNSGYTRDVNLFAANYDWRMAPGPVDGAVDGVLENPDGTPITGDQITDATYEYGVDYLGYWVSRAALSWAAGHGGRLPETVDVISHSTGGLVIRAYLQSGAYGASAKITGGFLANGLAVPAGTRTAAGVLVTSTLPLPRVNDLVTMGVPMRGAPGPFQLSQNDWGEDSATVLLGKVLSAAYTRHLAGIPIFGPSGVDIAGAVGGRGIDPVEFTARYCPTLTSLTGTYPFLFDDTRRLKASLVTERGTQVAFNESSLANRLLLDLNDGLDLIYGPDALANDWSYTEKAGDPNPGRIHFPTFFLGSLTGDLTVIYTASYHTPTLMTRRVGPASSQEEGDFGITPFTNFQQSNALPGQIWYVSNMAEGKPGRGDNSVPVQSSVGLYRTLGSATVRTDPSLHLHLRELNYSESESRSHSGMVGSADGIRTVLEALDRASEAFIVTGNQSYGTDLSKYLMSGYWNAPPAPQAPSLLGASSGGSAGLQVPPVPTYPTLTTAQLGAIADGLLAVKSKAIAGFSVGSEAMDESVALLARSLKQGPLVLSASVETTFSAAAAAVRALPNGSDVFAVMDVLADFGLVTADSLADLTATRVEFVVEYLESTVTNTALALGSKATELGISFASAPVAAVSDYFSLAAEVEIDVTLSVAETFGLTDYRASQGVYIADTAVDSVVSMGASGPTPSSGGTVTIDAYAYQRLADPTDDDRLSGAELAAAPIESVSTMTGQGEARAALPTATDDEKVVYATASSPFGTEPDVYVGGIHFDAIKDRLRDLLEGMAAVGDALENPVVQTVMQVPLPFLDDPGNNTIDELLTDDRYGFGLGEYFNLVDVLLEYCEDVSEPNLDGLVDRLIEALRLRLGEGAEGGLAHGPISISGGFDVDGGTFALVIEWAVEKTIEAELTEEGFGPEANGLGLDLSVPVTAVLGFESEVVLGMNLTGYLLQPASGISKTDVSLEFNRLRTTLDLSVADLDAPVTLGFLTAGIENGRVALTTAIDFSVFGGLPISLAQLETTSPTSLIALSPTPTGTLDVSLPLSATVGGREVTEGCSPSITITDANIFDTTVPVVAMTDFACLRDFCNLTPDQVLAMLKGLGDWLAQFRDSSVFDLTVPFSSGMTFGDVFDFSKAFVDAIYSQLIRIEIVAAGVATDSVRNLGRIAFDANFQLQVDDAAPVSVLVKALDTAINSSLEQLADHFNAALALAGLGSSVEATIGEGRRLGLRLKQGSGASKLKLTVPDPDGTSATPNTDAMVAEIGFAATQYSVEVPDYTGVEELGDRISEALGEAGVPLDVELVWDTADGKKEIRMEISFDQTLVRTTSFTFDPDLGLGPLVDASASGSLTFTAELHAGFVLGFDLNAKTTPRIQTSALIPPPSSGVLTADAHFTLKLDDTRYEVVVPRDAANASLADLVADINARFTPANGLQARVAAQTSGNAILLVVQDAFLGQINSIQIVGNENDTTFTELGFGNGQVDRSDVKGLFVDQVVLEGSLRMEAEALGAAFRFGVFSIEMEDGVAIALGSVQVALQSPTGLTRFSLDDLKLAAPDFGSLLKVAPVLTGSIDITAPTLSISPDLVDLPEGEGIRIHIPDLHFTDYNDSPYHSVTNPRGLFITLPTVGGLGNFSCLTFLNIVQALDSIADELEAMQGFGFLGQPIPLINLSLGDLLDSAGNFAELVEGLATADANTIETLEKELEDFFQVSDRRLITLSVDDFSPDAFGGGSPSSRVFTRFNPSGLANAIRFEARTVGTEHRGVRLEFVDDGRYTGITDDARVEFDAINRTLRIFYHAGYTTAARVVSVINADSAQPFQASLDSAAETGSGTGTISLTALKFSLHYNLAYGAFLPLDLGLTDLVALLPAGDPARTLLGGIGSLVQLEGSANLNVTASADLLLEFGIDVSNPCAWVPFLYDTTALTLNAAVRGTDIEFVAAVGPLGVFVKDGTVTVDRDGDPSTTGEGEDAIFAVTVNDPDGDGRHYLRDGLSFVSDLAINLEAGARAALPLCFPTESVPVGSNRDDNRDGHPDNELVVEIPSLPDLFRGTGSPVRITTPDLAGLLLSFNVCDLVTNASVLLDGLDVLLGMLQDGLQSEVLNRNLPLVGDDLAKAGDFIEEFREGLLADIRTKLASVGDPIDLVKQAFWNVLGSPGLNLLVDEAGNALGSVDDIDIACEQVDGEVVVLFNIQLAKTLALVDTRSNPIAFDIGIPGLGLEVNGNVVVEIGFELNLFFGISASDGFFFDTNGRNDASAADDLELTVFFRVTVPELSVTGNLLFLQAQVSDESDGVDANGLPRAVTHFEGHFNVDIWDASGRLSFSEMMGGGFNLGRTFVVELEAEAEVHLDLEISFGDDARFPRLLAEFDLVWTWDPLSGSGDEGADGDLEFGFRNLQLDLGSFIAQFLIPVLEQIKVVLEPAKPLIDLLTMELPVFSDLNGGPLTLLKLGENAGLIAPSTRLFIEAVDVVFDLVDDTSVSPSDGLLVNLGSFDLLLDSLGKIQSDGSLSDDPIDPADGTTDADAKGFLGSLERIGFTFPFLKLSELFKLFTGQPVSFVEFEMPLLEFEAKIDFQIPIFPPLYIIFGGSIGATIDLTFGYDSLGLQMYFANPDKDIADLFQGFYVKDVDDYGNEITELTLSGGLFAGAELNILVASAGVTGGIYADVLFDLRDPDEDGRVRVSEIVANAKEGPLCIFDVAGRIYVSLDAFLEVNLLIAKIDKEWNFGEITLLEFGIECPQPLLASFDTNANGTESAAEMTAGQLVLHMGEYAALRLHGDTADGDEIFIVRPLTPLAGGSQSVNVSFGGITQTYHGVKSILVKAGNGRDTVDLTGVEVAATAYGGAGDDTLKASRGGGVYWGDDGNDTLTSEEASGAFAGVGDEFHGGAGNDTLRGWEGVDRLYGDSGDDLLEGGMDGDTLEGGDGHDTLEGGDGDDSLNGGGGVDGLWGGADDDLLLGGEGDDLLEGETGDDWLIGNAGDDTLSGGAGEDVLVGDEGTILSGLNITGVEGDGNDTLSGGPGDDVLLGAGGNDALFGGNYVPSGITSIVPVSYRLSGGGLVAEPDGADFLDGGEGDDVIMADDAHSGVATTLAGAELGDQAGLDLDEDGIQDEGEPGLPTVSIEDTSVVEGDEGRAFLVFTVSISSTASELVTVCYKTELDTDASTPNATAGVDFESTEYTLVFHPGVLSLIIEVPVIGDLKDEQNEVIWVTLCDAYMGTEELTIADGTGVGTILDDDEAPGVSIADASVIELDGAATTQLVFTVTLTHPSWQTLSFDWRLLQTTQNDGSPAVDTATVGVDYIDETGVVTFLEGVTSQTFDVTIRSDELDEYDEKLLARLSRSASTSASGFEFLDDSALGTILDDNLLTPGTGDDDLPPFVTIRNLATGPVLEGHAGNVSVSLELGLGRASGREVRVDWSTNRGTALETATLTEAADFVGAFETVVFDPGETSRVITVDIVGDTTVEPSEYFFVNLISAVNGRIGTTATQANHAVVTIQDDESTDPGPWFVQFSQASYSVVEGGIATVTLARAGNSSQPLAVYWAAGGTATPGVDYDDALVPTAPGRQRGLVRFEAGEVLKTFTIATYDNQTLFGRSIYEGDETILLHLANPTGGPVRGLVTEATLTIVEDDPAPVITIADAASTGHFALEKLSDGSAGTLSFTVSVVGASEVDIKVRYASINGTAVAENDFVTRSGILTFPAANIHVPQIIAITSKDDSEVEDVEDLYVVLSDPVNATLGDNLFDSDATGGDSSDDRGYGVILDDDTARVSGTLFLDANGNGFLDGTADTGLNGVRITFTSETSGVAYAATSGSSGAYEVALPLDDYTVAVDESGLPEGASATTRVLPTLVAVEAEGTILDLGFEVVEAEPATTASTGSSSRGNNDTAYGGSGSDVLDGGAGDDWLVGGHWLGPGCSCEGLGYDVALVETLSGSTRTRVYVDPSSLPAPGTLQGRVWVDTDGDQTERKPTPGNEAGLAGVPVNLYDEGWVLVGTAYTDANGGYSFTNLTACDYRVQFLLPGGHVLVTKGVGGSANDSDADPATGLTDAITVGEGRTVSNVDAGIRVLPAGSAPWNVSFSHALYSVRESDGNAVITLLGDAASLSPVAAYFTANGSATVVTDYTETRGTVRFGAGESEKTVLVGLVADTVEEGYETVLLTLRNPTGGLVKGAQPSAVLLIFDNPCPDDDEIFGQEGNDVLLGDFGWFTNAGVPVLLGGMGNDLLVGHDGDDTLEGEGGNDTLEGGSGDDTLNGGSENDTYRFDTDGVLGTDTVGEGEAPLGGADTLDFSTSGWALDLDLTGTSMSVQNGTTVILTLFYPANRLENVFAGSGDDVIRGNDFDNILDAGAGDDVLEGRGGDDDLTGGAGSDLYLFDADLNLGHDDLFEAASRDTDTIDFGETTLQSVSLNLSLTTSQVVAPTLTLTVNTVAAEQTLVAVGGILQVVARVPMPFGSSTPASSAIENLFGGRYAPGTGVQDQLWGNSRDNVIWGREGNDVLDGGTSGYDTLKEERAGNWNLTATSLSNATTGEVDTFDASRFDSIHLVGDSAANVLDASSFSGVVVLDGAGGDDTLIGGSGTNTLTGGPGSDHIDGSRGVDLLVEERDAEFKLTATDLVVGAERDSFTGTIESAHLIGGDGANTLDARGFNGPVTLEGRGGNDALFGGSQGDVLVGGGGKDGLDGGAGNDVYRFDTDDELDADTVTELPGGGVDTLDFSESESLSVTVSLALGTDQLVNGNLTLRLTQPKELENLVGSQQDDVLAGNSGTNVIDGQSGNDRITGDLGSDTLSGGDGVNTSGLGYRDTLVESRDTNWVLLPSELKAGGVTEDILSGFEAAELTGGAGNNTLDASGFGGDVRLEGMEGKDTLVGGVGNDILIGGGGDDSLAGGEGNDTYRFDTDSALGADTANDSGGEDVLDFSETRDRAVQVSLASGSVQVVNGNLSLTLASTTAFENLRGGARNDQLTGNSVANVLEGGDGNDRMNGGEGDDLLIGGDGDDTYRFSLGSGADQGADTVLENVGTGGTDTLEFQGTPATGVVLDLGIGHRQEVHANLDLILIRCHAIEAVLGTPAADLITGNSLDNHLDGRGGGDVLDGGLGEDTLVYGSPAVRGIRALLAAGLIPVSQRANPFWKIP